MFDGLIKLCVFLNVHGTLSVLLLLLVVLDNRFILELSDMSRHPFEIGLELSDL